MPSPPASGPVLRHAYGGVAAKGRGGSS